MANVTGYSRAQIFLHWAIVLLLIVSYLSSDAMSESWRAFRDGREVLSVGTAVHVWLGVLILLLAFARLVIRVSRGAPALPAGGHGLTDLVAKITHLGLYIGVVLIPAAGLAAWFGGVEAAGEVHEVMFNLLMLLVVLHVGGALYHQFALKDGLIRRMMRAG